MKVLALCASTRVEGNCDTSMDETIRGAQDAGAACLYWGLLGDSSVGEVQSSVNKGTTIEYA